MVRDPFNKHEHPVINTISRVFAVLFLAISALFVFRVSTSNLLPGKYFWLILLVLVVLNFIFIHITFRRRTNRASLILFDVFATIVSLGLIFSSFKLNELTNFINQNFGNDKKYSVYNVIVNKDSKANKLSDLSGSELFTYEEPVKEISNDELKEAVKNVISDSTLTFRDDLDVVMNRAANLAEVGSVINNGTYESYIAVNEDFADKVKIIGEIKIEIKGIADNDKTEPKSTIADEPFLLLINGIDTNTGTMPTRSLSDVNILAAVNPKTKKITLVAIPRDTYVQLHGTTGLKDKLTHSGSRGGVDLTVSTIEDFMDTKIDRYIRVNFNFLVDLVDNIGGITVYSDESKTITTAINHCKIKPGNNDLDGKCALGFARERKQYKDGDRQRGRNQEQVITRILEKVSHDKNIINDSGKILAAMNGSFDTNITSDDITSLVKMQLDDMSSWTVESYNIDGKGEMTKTYSYPNQNLYVMIPNEKTVTTAKAKLLATLQN